MDENRDDSDWDVLLTPAEKAYWTKWHADKEEEVRTRNQRFFKHRRARRDQLFAMHNEMLASVEAINAKDRATWTIYEKLFMRSFAKFGDSIRWLQFGKWMDDGRWGRRSNRRIARELVENKLSDELPDFLRFLF